MVAPMVVVALTVPVVLVLTLLLVAACATPAVVRLVAKRRYPDLQARILAACKAALADFKQPRRVTIVAEMPRSTLEKINKVELRKDLPVLSGR